MSLSELELQAFSSFEKTGWGRAADPYHHHWGNLSRQSAEPMLDAAKVKKAPRYSMLRLVLVTSLLQLQTEVPTQLGWILPKHRLN